MGQASSQLNDEERAALESGDVFLTPRRLAQRDYAAPNSSDAAPLRIQSSPAVKREPQQAALVAADADRRRRRRTVGAAGASARAPSKTNRPGPSLSPPDQESGPRPSMLERTMDFAIDPQLHALGDHASYKQHSPNQTARLALEQTGDHIPAPPPAQPAASATAEKPKKKRGRKKKTDPAPVVEPAAEPAAQSVAPAMQDQSSVYPEPPAPPAPEVADTASANGEDHAEDASTNGTAAAAVDLEANTAVATADDEEEEAGQEGQAGIEAEGDNSRKRKRTGKEKAKRAKKIAKRTDRSPSLAAPAVLEADGEEIQLPDAGTFIKVELEMIDQFMKQFREDHNMTQQELNGLIHNKARGNEERANALWNAVFDLLPRRKDRRSIRLTCRRRYHNYEQRGTWSAEDDQSLRVAYAKAPNKWSAIGTEIGRMPEDCKDRWQNYVGCGDSRRSGDWTEKEEMQLTLAIEECKDEIRKMQMEEAEKNNKPFEEREDWQSLISFKTVSAKMGHVRSGLQCRQHWKRMNARDQRLARESQAPSHKKKTWRDHQALDNFKRMLWGDKYLIMCQLRDTETTSEHNIPWKMISREHPDSKWTTKDRKVTFERLKPLAAGLPTLTDTLEGIIKWIEDHHPNELQDFYDGLVRSQDTVKREPKRARSDEADEAAPPRKRQARSNARTSTKKATKSADVVTASDEEQSEDEDGQSAGPDGPSAELDNVVPLEELTGELAAGGGPGPAGLDDLDATNSDYDGAMALPTGRALEKTPEPAGIHNGIKKLRQTKKPRMAPVEANPPLAAADAGPTGGETVDETPKPKRPRGRPRKNPKPNDEAGGAALQGVAPVARMMVPAAPRVIQTSDEE